MSRVENFNTFTNDQVSNQHLCSEVYNPENRQQFNGGQNKQSHNCESDDDFNKLFDHNLNQNIYDCKKGNSEDSDDKSGDNATQNHYRTRHDKDKDDCDNDDTKPTRKPPQNLDKDKDDCDNDDTKPTRKPPQDLDKDKDDCENDDDQTTDQNSVNGREVNININVYNNGATNNYYDMLKPGSNFNLNPGEFGLTSLGNNNNNQGEFNPLDPLGFFGNDKNGLSFLPPPPNPFDLFGGNDNSSSNNGNQGFNLFDPLGLFGGNDNSSSDNNSGNPLSFLPKPPNPFDLFGGNNSSDNNSGNPLSFLPKPPNPFDLFGGNDNSSSSSDNNGGGPLDFLPQPPNPMDLVKNLPKPPSPADILRPDKMIKKIFGGLF